MNIDWNDKMLLLIGFCCPYYWWLRGVRKEYLARNITKKQVFTKTLFCKINKINKMRCKMTDSEFLEKYGRIIENWTLRDLEQELKNIDSFIDDEMSPDGYDVDYVELLEKKLGLIESQIKLEKSQPASIG